MFKNKVVSALLKKVAEMIPFNDLSRYLPFQTRIVSGDTFNHIQSQTAYDIQTYGKPTLQSGVALPYYSPVYTVSEDDTLCRRAGRSPSLYNVVGGFMRRDCPGCTAIAHGIIKRDLEQANG